MNLPNHEKLEKEFLEDMATSWGFKDKIKIVFVQRLLTANNDLKNEQLADVLKKNLTQGAKANADPARIQRDYLRGIFQKLEREGCDFKGATRDKREIAQQWLREKLYPDWLKARFWQQLKDRGRPTDRMGVVLAPSAETLGMRRKTPSAFLKTVPKDSDILFKVNLDRSGHLILLEREPGGVVCCLCPSEYAPNSQHPVGEAVLPQAGSPHSSFAPNEIGREQIVAILIQEVPPLEWLPHSKQEALKLDDSHLYELLEYLGNSSEVRVLHTEYEVISNPVNYS